MTEIEEKKAFAKALFENPGDAYSCSQKIFPNDPNRAVIACNRWPNDIVVLRELSYLRGETKDAIHLPGKEEHCRDLYDIFLDPTIKTSDRLVASEQYAKMMGHLIDQNENTIINNKIMIVTNNGSDSDWERKIKENQDNLRKNIIKVEAVEVGAIAVKNVESVPVETVAVETVGVEVEKKND